MGADIIKRIRTIIENDIIGLDKIREQNKELKKLEQVNQDVARNESAGTNETKKNTNSKRDNSRASRDQLIGNLGVMFAGMALQRAMSNLNQTAKEWVGTGEIMSTTMGVVMLPATINFLEKGVLPLSEALLGLDEDTQKSIGNVALALEGLGGSFMFLGQVGLARQSLPLFIKDWKRLTLAIGGSAGALALISVALAAFVIKKYVDSLADYADAWDAVGVSVESATDALGQYGQMTRTIDTGLTGPLAEQAAGITPESLGITPTGTDTSQFPLVSDFGPSLPGAEAPKNFNFFREGLNTIFGGKNQEAQGSNSSIVQNNNFNGFGMEQVDEQINRNNQVLTDSLSVRL